MNNEDILVQMFCVTMLMGILAHLFSSILGVNPLNLLLVGVIGGATGIFLAYRRKRP
jgi:Flp pilus assembly protein TadB